MPPVIASIMAFIQLALKAAPTVKQVYEDAHALIDEMFKTKLITKEQQAAAHKWADDHQAAVLEQTAAGQTPPEMKVTPDAPVATDKSQAILDTLANIVPMVQTIHAIATGATGQTDAGRVTPVTGPGTPAPAAEPAPAAALAPVPAN